MFLVAALNDSPELSLIVWIYRLSSEYVNSEIKLYRTYLTTIDISHNNVQTLSPVQYVCTHFKSSREHLIGLMSLLVRIICFWLHWSSGDLYKRINSQRGIQLPEEQVSIPHYMLLNLLWPLSSWGNLHLPTDPEMSVIGGSTHM